LAEIPEDSDAGPPVRIASGSADGTIRIWDVATGSCDVRLEPPIAGTKHSVTLLVLLSGGCLISGDESGALWQWDMNKVENPEVKEEYDGFIAFKGKPSSLQAVPVGKPKKSKSDPAVGHSRAVMRVEELSNGKILTGGWDGHCKIWRRPEASLADPARAEWIPELDVRGHSPILLSDTRLVCVAYGDMKSRNCLWYYEIEYDEESDPDAKKPPKLTLCRTMTGHQSDLVGAIKLDRDQILSYSEDMSIRLWSSRNFQCKLVLKGHQGKVSVFSFCLI